MKYRIWVIILILIAASAIVYGYLGYNRPTVSVVMLTYKRAEILPLAIESILAQTYKDFEFIILNDGSPDNTDDVVKKYKDKRIRYYKNKQNKGIAYSRNRTASLARGKYIMIMDDDDISLPERMQKQVSFLQNRPEITVVAGQIEGLKRIPDTHNDIASRLIQYNNIGNANIMYRADFNKKHHIFYDESLKVSEDWDFWLKMLFQGAKFSAISEDVLQRNATSLKHYKENYEDANPPIRERVGAFFSKKDSSAFYTADACTKLQMIAPKHILSEEYLQDLLQVNNCL